MHKQHFDQIVQGVTEMKRHLEGEVVNGLVTTVLTTKVQQLNKVSSLVETMSGSQRQLKKFTDVKLFNLQNGVRFWLLATIIF